MDPYNSDEVAMHSLLGLTLFLVSFSAFSQGMTQAIGEGYTEVRGGAAHAISSFFRGDCAAIQRGRQCDECRADAVSGVAQTQVLTEAIGNLSRTEDAFFRTAASQQREAVRCDIRQLEALSTSDPQNEFQRTIMRDVQNKLPELRLRYNRIQRHQRRIDAAQGIINGITSGKSAGSPAWDADLVRARAVIAEEVPKRDREAAVFNPLFASLWRFHDPHMSAFLMGLITSNRPPGEICAEALQDDADNGFLGYRAMIGRREFSFREQVLNRMLEESRRDVRGLDASFSGSSFDLSRLGSSSRRMLVRNSEWAEQLVQSGEAGNTANAYFMCEMDRTYGQGDTDMLMTAEALTFLAGGGGAILKVARFATMLRPAMVQRALTASRVLAVASYAPAIPLSITYVADACISPTAQNSYTLNGSCSTDPSHMVQVERTRLNQENCVLNVALAGLAIAPGTMEFLGRFRQGSRIADAAAEEARLVARNRATQAREQRYLSMEDDNAVVVTARRRRRPSSRPAANAWETRAAELSDATATRSELDDVLRQVSDDVPALNQRLQTSGVNAFLANEGSELTAESQARLRVLNARLERHRARAAASVVNPSEIDTLTRPLNLTDETRALINRRLNEDTMIDFREIISRTGTNANDRAKIEYILDEITGLGYYNGRQRDQAMLRIIDQVNNWNRGGARQQVVTLVQQRRTERLARDTQRAQEQIRRTSPAMPEDELRRSAEALALTRRERRLVLQRACTDTRLGGNSISGRVGTSFVAQNLYLGVGATAVTFAAANWNQVKDLDWAKRLGYEVVQAYILSRYGGRINRNQSSSLAGKIGQNLTLNTILSSVESSAYVSFFGGNEDEARRRLIELQRSPTLDADLAAMEEFVNNRSGIEEAVDSVTDFGNNLARAVTGREAIQDLTVDEISRLGPDALRDPAVMDRVMDTIEDQLYSEELGGDTYGNQFIDRMAYDAEWNINPILGVPRTVVVGIASYYAFCTNIDNPVMAFAALGLIQGTSRTASGFYYYSQKAEEIGQ